MLLGPLIQLCYFEYKHVRYLHNPKMLKGRSASCTCRSYCTAAVVDSSPTLQHVAYLRLLYEQCNAEPNSRFAKSHDACRQTPWGPPSQQAHTPGLPQYVACQKCMCVQGPKREPWICFGTPCAPAWLLSPLLARYTLSVHMPSLLWQNWARGHATEADLWIARHFVLHCVLLLCEALWQFAAV